MESTGAASATDRLSLISGRDVRQACRTGVFSGQTSGAANGYTQANLAVVPSDLAFDFLEFCRRNPKPCPVLDVTEPGSPVPGRVAPDADLRSDLPRYRIWKNGEVVDEPTDASEYWRDDFVAFVIGCSFTFESAMLRAEIPIRHVELGCNVPMYCTNIPCRESGPFKGSMVVSMRPLSPADAIRSVQITSRFPSVHGAPVHLGLPEQIGITDLSRPDFGEAVPINEGEIPVFWACGVTPQVAIMNAKPPLAITHSPGCMFVTDLTDESLAVG